MNKEIEEKLLENSKGATYMSFILDVEIVIKKEGAGRVNLAESKVRSDRIPYKKGESSKDSKQSNALGKQSEVKVYSMLAEPVNVMNQHTRVIEETQNVSMSEQQDSEEKNHKSENETTKLNEMSENEEIDKIVEEVADEIEVTPAEKLIQKKRKRKEERKARVFKGKVEKIDFLECNRIFMCNYFKIPNCRIPNKTVKSYGQSISSLLLSKRTPKEAVPSTSESQAIILGQKQSSTCSKKNKIWRKNTNNLPVHDKIFEPDFSFGDCTNRAQMEYVEIEDGNEMILKQPRNMNCQQVIQFNPPVITIESNFATCIPTPLPIKQSRNKNYSTWNFLGHITKAQNKPFKKSESWPLIHNNQIKSTALLCPKHIKPFKECFAKTTKNKQKSNIKMYKGLSSLEITFFNNTNKSINPQVSVENGITQFMHISQNYTCKNIASEHLTEMKQDSVLPCGSRISKTITNPLNTDRKMPSKSDLQTLNCIEAQNIYQLNKGKPKRNIMQFFYKLVK